MRTTDRTGTGQRPRAGRPTRDRVLWALQLVTGLGFVGAAIQKFQGAPDVMHSFDGMGWGARPRIALAVLEVIGAVALVVPALIEPAAAAFVVLTTGATIVQIVTGGSVLPPLVMLFLSTAVLWGRWGSARLLRQMLGRTTEPSVEEASQ